MSDDNVFFLPKISLSAACPAIFHLLKKHLLDGDQAELSLQLDAVFVPSQVIGGTGASFSFMAYPLPRLTSEERGSMEFVEEGSVFVSEQDTEIRIDLDGFGRINWFHVRNFPVAFQQLVHALSAN